MVSDMNIFDWKLSKIAAQKKVFFFTFFVLLRFSIFFNGLFAPTSRSRMSNIFRDLESLRRSNGKKWSNIWTFLFGSGLKSPRKKNFFFAEFALVHPPMASVLLSALVERCFVSRMRDFSNISSVVLIYWRRRNGNKFWACLLLLYKRYFISKKNYWNVLFWNEVQVVLNSIFLYYLQMNV